MFQILGGAAAGALLMMLAPSLKTSLNDGLRGLLKAVIKGGCLAIQSGRAAVHESTATAASAWEALEDLAAEARAEISEPQEEQQTTPPRTAESSGKRKKK